MDLNWGSYVGTYIIVLCHHIVPTASKHIYNILIYIYIYHILLFVHVFPLMFHDFPSASATVPPSGSSSSVVPVPPRPGNGPMEVRRMCSPKDFMNHYPLVNKHRPWQIGVGRLVSIKHWWFSGSMFIYQRVIQCGTPPVMWMLVYNPINHRLIYLAEVLVIGVINQLNAIELGHHFVCFEWIYTS